MRLTILRWFVFASLISLVVTAPPLYAQGVTTSSITALVVDSDGNPLPGANVIAVHIPSGTTYGGSSRADGRVTIPGMRVGGPYTVTVSYVGFETSAKENIFLTLGVATDLEFVMRNVGVQIGEIVVTAQRDPIFSSERTGAATSIDREVIEKLPTISRRMTDFARLTPQYYASSFGPSFAGQDNRLNNITVDGSYFNNSFGLGGQPGDRTNVAPISMDAIEQMQINVAPYDVRQGHFVGAGLNTVTRSGTNNLSGSVYYQFRAENLVGRNAKDATVDPGKFKYNLFGLRLGGPIIPNRLFFFASYEKDQLTEPGTTYVANTGGQTVGGNITRVLASDLNQLSAFLKEKFNYETGPYQGYDHEVPATRFLARLDFNLDERNKISLRYNHLDSKTDVLLSNSSSLGFGTRRSTTTGLNFRNSNYLILENIRSIVGEWNTRIGDNMANSLIVGYSYHDESRDSRGTMFPFVDILSAGTVYTSFGFEPFTPNNELRYGSFQVQNNLTLFSGNHTMTFGFSAERYESENVFFPGSQSVYVYNSLDDFYRDANDYLANPNRTSSPVTLRRFQVRWSNIPGQEKPIQPLKVFYAGIYAQDEWQVTKDLRLTLGIRADVPFFGDTGYENSNADGLTFQDENRNPVSYKTKKLPDPHINFSPRVGFNWDLFGNRTTQLRGGTGLFSGPPIYVWISNQIGNTGVLTGFEQRDNIPAGTPIANGGRPFNPNPNAYKPTNVTGAPASSYELALTDPNFRFPQLWRTNVGVDQRLPFGLVGTAEFLYNKDINGIYYINANLKAPDSRFVGADDRPRWSSTAAAVTRLNTHVANAIVLKNQSVGYSWNFSATLELPYRDGFFAKVGYNYGESKNTIDPGSIAFGSWNNNQHPGDPNNPGLGFSSYSPGNRVFAAFSYTFGNVTQAGSRFGATTVSLFWDAFTPGNYSYVFGGDMNNDGGTTNDLIYIHRDVSEMNFQQFTSAGRTFTAAEQAAAWDAFIKQDPYLSKNRGKYAERNAAFLPIVIRADFSISQDVYAHIFGSRNTLQFRADFLNVGNLLNKNWGVNNRPIGGFGAGDRPLIPQGVDAQGRALYRLRTVNNELISKSFEPTATLSDVFRIQFSVRYIFN